MPLYVNSEYYLNSSDGVGRGIVIFFILKFRLWCEKIFNPLPSNEKFLDLPQLTKLNCVVNAHNSYSTHKK